MRGAHAAVVLLLASRCVGCGLPSSAPRGMHLAIAHRHTRDPSLIELARVDPHVEERPLLVVFPKSACSGSASGVLVDDEGRFLGAFEPGTAALLAIPKTLRRLVAFSSVEVTAPIGTWRVATSVVLPPAPSGLLLTSTRWSTRECGNGQFFEVVTATKSELENELGESDLRWLVPAPREGQAWLDAHHERVAEVLAPSPSASSSGDLAHSSLR